jgi:hypothetical protein
VDHGAEAKGRGVGDLLHLMATATHGGGGEVVCVGLQTRFRCVGGYMCGLCSTCSGASADSRAHPISTGYGMAGLQVEGGGEGRGREGGPPTHPHITPTYLDEAQQ